MASSYLHGTEPVEQKRLSLLNDLLNQSALKELVPRPGERILDVGSGLGQLARAMGRTGAIVVGVEKSPEQIAEARRQAREAGEQSLLDLREGDALALPLSQAEWGSFDIAHTRFVLEHVTDPLGVVREMVRAVKPGGRIILQDDDHDVLRIWPEPAGWSTLWQAYMRTYDRLGNDPYVGRRLVALLHQAGTLPRRNTWLFFGGCSGNPTFEILVDNLVGILQGARETMLRQALLEAEQFGESIAAIRAWSQRPDAAFWFAVCYAEGIRPDQR